MSAGLSKSIKSNEFPDKFSTGTPSMTYKGKLLSEIDEKPRIVIVEDAPTLPDVFEIITPATFPLSELTVSASTLVTE